MKSREEQTRIERKNEPEEKNIRARNVGSRETLCFFPWFVGGEGRKNRLTKATGAEPCGRRRSKKLHAAVARSTCLKSFGSSDVEKWHATVALSTFWSQNVQNTCAFPSQNVQNTVSEHLSTFGPLEVRMSKSCPTDETDRSIYS